MGSGWQQDTVGEMESGAATLLAGPVRLGPGWAAQGEGGEGGEGNTARASTWGGPRGVEKGRWAHWAVEERGSRPKTRESEREK